MFLDVRKAFDTVDHHLLLSKLAKEGVGGVVLRWFYSYLSGRRQFVKVGGESSLSTPVVRGAPQGSKLGPLLFNFYTADLPRAVPSVCSIILYADDACIYTSDNSLDGVVKHLQEGVNSTANWYRENLMSLNGRKSNLVLFPKFRNKSCLSNYKLSVDSAQLLPSPSAKYLGIFFDSQLNWKVHVDSVVRKVSRKIDVLYRCYRFLNTSARLALVKSVIQPDMDYGAVIWNNGSAQVANRLNRIEKRHLRVLEGLSYRDRTSMVGGVSSLLNKFGIRSVKCRHMLHLGRLVQRSIHGRAPNIVSDVFVRKNQNCYHTRLGGTGLFLARPNTEALRQSSMFRGRKLWNSLPSDIRSVVDPVIFNFLLKKNLSN